jgi:predicted phage-related endonuclease
MKGYFMAKLLGNFESGSAEWLALREGDAVVTGTLAGIVCGWSQWESPFTAWAKATGRIPSEIKQSLAMRFGQVFESGIKQVWSELNPEFVIHDDVGTYAHDDHDWARANPDGLLTYPDGSMGVLEVKTARVPFDEVPLNYRAQVLWYCWVMGLRKAKLVALFSGNDLKEFDIEFDDFEFAGMLSAVERWRKCVLDDVKPEWDGSANTLETVKFLNPGVSDSGVDLGDLGISVQNAQSEFDKAQTHLNEMKSRTLDALGDSKYGFVEVSGEQYVVCTRAVNRNGVVSLSIKKGKNV